MLSNKRWKNTITKIVDLKILWHYPSEFSSGALAEWFFYYERIYVLKKKFIKPMVLLFKTTIFWTWTLDSLPSLSSQ